MKNTLYSVFTFFLLLLSCNDKEETSIPDMLPPTFETTIDGNNFTIDTVFAYKVLDEYLISLGNDTETLFIRINDTIEGDYEIIANPFKFENDTISFSDNLLTQKTIASASYLRGKNAYISKKGGILSITKDENYKISGKFNFSLANINDTNDVIELNNGFFNNINPLIYKEPNIVNPEEFYKRKEDVEAALQTVYNSSISTEQQHVLVDALYTNQVEDRVFGSIADIKNHTLTPKDQTLSKLWDDYYRTIFRANQVLENAYKVYPNDTDGLNIILSQAYTLRAYTYASLVNWFGEVPLVLKTAKGTPDLNPLFNSISEIESQIIIDLNFAIDHLPHQSDSTKISVDFAKLLLARVYFKQENYNKTIENLTTITIPTSGNNIYSINTNTIEDYLQNSVFNRFIKKDKLIFGTYSEVLLMLSEAYNQNNKPNLAIENLNKLNLDTSITGQKTKTELSDLIFDQWSTTLPLDGNRFYILKKFNKAIDLLTIEPYQLILPIPENEISVNAKQNPGY